MSTAAMNAIDAVFGRLYAIPAPSRPHRPLQVLCVGPSRSGTDSLRQALQQLGYAHVFHGYETLLPHNRHQKPILSKLVNKKYRSGRTNGDVAFTAEEFDELLGEYDAATDMPVAMFAAELAAVYPEAKVVLNRRVDVDAWYRSVQATFIPSSADWYVQLRTSTSNNFLSALSPGPLPHGPITSACLDLRCTR